MIFNNAVPPQDAIDFANKVIAPAPMTSSEWNDVPAQLRARAFFSSRVENAQFLQEARDKIQDYLKNNRDAAGALKTGGRSKFVNDMQAWLKQRGVVREGGGLTDITSQRRLGLIFNTQVAQAFGYGNWKAGMDPDVLNEFPAMRFIRVISVKEPRLNHARYQDSVFLKTDPIWYAVINQDFGVPWGPWGWGCGHDVEDVDRDEAEGLGLLGPEDVLKPDPKWNLNTGLQASVKRMDPDLVAKLKAVFGDRIKMEGDSINWVAAAPPANVPAPAVPAPVVVLAAPANKANVPNPAANVPTVAAPPAIVSPAAPAVSDALNIVVRNLGLRDQVKMALSAIDAVHDDGVLPAIDLNSMTQASLGKFQYRISGRVFSADSILIRGTGDWPALTTVHEVGHFLDLEGIGAKGKFATMGDADMAKVLAAADQTSAIQGLRAQLASTTSAAVRRRLEYLLTPQEIWARAYAQFIASRSGYPALAQQLDVAFKNEKFYQWAPDDYVPIADAIQVMFKTLGWM